MKRFWTHTLVAVIASLVGWFISTASGGKVPAPLASEVVHVVLDPTVPDMTAPMAVDATVAQ